MWWAIFLPISRCAFPQKSGQEGRPVTKLDSDRDWMEYLSKRGVKAGPTPTVTVDTEKTEKIGP